VLRHDSEQLDARASLVAAWFLRQEKAEVDPTRGFGDRWWWLGQRAITGPQLELRLPARFLYGGREL
jgi:hypothetical protein